MEIKEIVSYFLNLNTNILEVSFRTIDDDDELIRTDNIDYDVVSDYGYELESEVFDFFGEEFDEEIDNDEKVELDESELISFLNEYYTVNSSSLPTAELY